MMAPNDQQVLSQNTFPIQIMMFRTNLGSTYYKKLPGFVSKTEMSYCQTSQIYTDADPSVVKLNTLN